MFYSFLLFVFIFYNPADMIDTLERLESRLQSSKPSERSEAVRMLADGVSSGRIQIPETSGHLNMHCHSFYSYNPDQHTPSMLAWMAKKHGLRAAGIVDFDVLDGVDEFLDAGRSLALMVIGGIETRVSLQELADLEINSPGEPGIAYHMGAGMPGSLIPREQISFLRGLKDLSQQRNRLMISKINPFLAPLDLSYEEDIVPLTPNGNATERHIALAYMEKASIIFEDDDELRSFWDEKLGGIPADIDCREGFDLQLIIRKKLMKRGGAGYSEADSGSFPKMHEFNDFVLACGGIPTLAWLDGTSDGEERLEELLDLEMKMGVAAVNLIPDRNYTKGEPDCKLAKMREFVQTADERGLPVLAGTELNAPGLKFVDDFECDELAPLLPIFAKGALLAYAHTRLQRECGMGFCSPWARIHFPDLINRNRYYHELAGSMLPGAKDCRGIRQDMDPSQVRRRLQEDAQ